MRPEVHQRAICCDEPHPLLGLDNLRGLVSQTDEIAWRGTCVRLSRKVRIVVTIIGTRFRSARALASRSTPKVCSLNAVSLKEYSLRNSASAYRQPCCNNCRTLVRVVQMRPFDSFLTNTSNRLRVAQFPGTASYCPPCFEDLG